MGHLSRNLCRSLQHHAPSGSPANQGVLRDTKHQICQRKGIDLKVEALGRQHGSAARLQQFQTLLAPLKVYSKAVKGRA